MYAEEYKQTTSNLSKHAAEKHRKNALSNNYSANSAHFDDMRIHYSPSPSSYARTSLFPLPSYKQGTVQMKLKITKLAADPNYEFTIDDLDGIIGEVYYGELADVASENEIRAKITELIQDDSLHSFENDYDLKDRLYEFFWEQASGGTVSDESAEDMPPIYTGLLHEHPLYHRSIKPYILSHISLEHLQTLLKNKKQKNFDFYIRRGHQLYVSDNHSKSAEFDTGYDIIVYENGECTITERKTDTPVNK